MLQEGGAAKAQERVAAKTRSGNSHIMISYCWAQQTVALRIRRGLAQRGYTRVWIDVEQMQGSTVDAMANAIDQSSGMLFCISSDYKKSPNCRMEAMYAHAAGVRLIPIMAQQNYAPRGWLGMLPQSSSMTCPSISLFALKLSI